MADDLGERTEAPTPRRRNEAREEGNVAKSTDIASALMLAAMVIVLFFSMVPMLRNLRSILEGLLDSDRVSNPLDPGAAVTTIEFALRGAIRAAMPALLAAWAIAFLSHFWQVGWLFAPKAVQPKLSKLNPLSGLKRIASLRSLVKASLDALKVLVVVLVAVHAIVGRHDELAALPLMSAVQALGAIGWMLLDVALRVAAALVVLGILDFAYQKWKHEEELKMTHQQVRDELKQNEGDPEVKRRRFRMQQQIAMQRISAAVPRADVIVTNPEHISIAIRYDEETMAAPKVVAKGADHLAMRIRQIALRHEIPIVERRPLARALYRECKVGQEIPPAYYKAVAEILAFVYRVGGRRAG